MVGSILFHTLLLPLIVAKFINEKRGKTAGSVMTVLFTLIQIGYTLLLVSSVCSVVIPILS